MNDDSNSGRDENTKQVGRDLLNKALNKSVDSQDIINRVNAQVGKELSDDEGTAKVDRESVRKYLEAARAGSPAPPGTPEPKLVDDSDPEVQAEADDSLDLVQSSDLPEPPLPDLTNPMAESVKSSGDSAPPKENKPPAPGSPRRAIPAPPSLRERVDASGEIPEQPEAPELSNADPGIVEDIPLLDDAIEPVPVHDPVEDRAASAAPVGLKAPARVHDKPVPAAPEDHASSTGSLIWFGVIALFGILLGVAIGIAYIVITGL